MKKQKIKYSKEHKNYLKKCKIYSLSIIFSRIILFLTFILLWEGLVSWGIIDRFYTSSPSRIWDMIKSLYQSKELFYHCFTTLKETLLAFSISTILGIIFAIMLWSNNWVRKVLEPYIVILNSLPKVALGPIIIIWIGSGEKAIITMAVLIVIMVTTINILSAFLNVDKSKIYLLKSLGANKFQIFIHLVFPASRNDLISTLKVNVGLSWVGAIMGEYLVCKAGLGYLLIYGSQTFKMDLVMTSIVLICILATLMYFSIILLEKYLKRR